MKLTAQDQIVAVAKAFLDFDDLAPEGPQLDAAIREASRICLAFEVLAQLHAAPEAEPVPLKRSSRSRRMNTTEH